MCLSRTMTGKAVWEEGPEASLDLASVSQTVRGPGSACGWEMLRTPASTCGLMRREALIPEALLRQEQWDRLNMGREPEELRLYLRLAVGGG